ncbi:hypothetical protein Xgly_08450 [Xanthomonas citri pv. glycines]|uniref:Uncharacterized protein n=1 Tax=Xanthomonas campestris pv. glycines TaxID=473421 RepID=A0AAX0HZ49_XANCG|nr:hypothetical protein BHE84_07195 [Xanthomonas citri pv. glycines str. 8ra]ARV24371.1 hypothetical protein A9D66_17650 [Xanthomonas citri pv. glycines str. 12-2]OEY89837.1 hypothetical protein BIY41_16830 [Xanthomonas citri pv. glycines]OOX04902.1 hypothetical protein Xgly_08450 [Xanthomonas citri pv. glycines]QDR47681.1 hypothetical protein FPK90_18630 [Xanthomonas citri pv. glycines]
MSSLGFIVRPLMARRGLRKAERDGTTRASVGASGVMPPLSVMGAFWVTSVLSGLPMVLVVLRVQLTS